MANSTNEDRTDVIYSTTDDSDVDDYEKICEVENDKTIQDLDLDDYEEVPEKIESDKTETQTIPLDASVVYSVVQKSPKLFDEPGRQRTVTLSYI